MENPYINWVDIDNSSDHTQTATATIASMLDENDMDEEFNEIDEDTQKWKSLVPSWVHDFNVFSKKKSE